MEIILIIIFFIYFSLKLTQKNTVLILVVFLNIKSLRLKNIFLLFKIWTNFTEWAPLIVKSNYFYLDHLVYVKEPYDLHDSLKWLINYFPSNRYKIRSGEQNNSNKNCSYKRIIFIFEKYKLIKYVWRKNFVL